MSDSPAVALERHEATALLRMSRPTRRNALDAEMRAELSACVEAVRRDPEVKAVVLTGCDGCFCAGGDLRGLSKALDSSRDVFEGRSRILEMHRWFEDFADLEKPVVVAVDGPAFGAGLSLTLAADYVLATRRASFCAVFARIGYVPDLGAMYLLPRQVGLRAAKDMVFTARVVEPEEALALGLVQTLVDENVEAAALAFARRFHDAPTETLGIAKAVMNRAFETGRQGVLAQEAMAQAICREGGFHQEAVRRFAAKEPPQYVWK